MEPKVSLIVSGNLYMRQMRFEKGDVEHQHCHTYDHLTLLATGSLKLTVDGVDCIVKAPTAIKVLANKEHRLEALEDNTLAYCVHALRDAQTEEVLPPQAHITDRETKVFSKTEGGLLIKPTPAVVEVDGAEVSLAPIAFLATEKINGGNFNRNQDGRPLVVMTPDGAPAGKEFV